MTYPQYLEYINTADTPQAVALRDNDIAALIHLWGGVVAVSATIDIPYTTIQNWLYKTRAPQPYLIRLIGYAMMSREVANMGVKPKK